VVSETPNVELQACGPELRPLLENLFQLYVHDFSEQWHGLPRGEVGEDGLFDAYDEWDGYWVEPDRVPLLIRADGHVAGFALINRFAHSGLPTDFSMAEFFVVRKHRRSGVGQTAALAILADRPGQWDIAVSRRNIGAQHFWRRVAALAAADGEVEDLDRDDDLWNGLILRFKVS
jgi:predicted acetyltransferase